jgi:hypothetical protein
MKIKIRLTFWIVLGWIFIYSADTYAQDNRELEDVIFKVINAYNDNDSISINNLISPEIGFYVVFKRGVFPEYQKTENLDFNKPIPEYLPYFDVKPTSGLEYERLPTYDCEEMEWSKIGLFCDTTSRDHLLSQTAQILKKYRNDNIGEEKINYFKHLEDNSQRIILIDNEGGELIFYLTEIKEKWYLTIIDRLTSDCSA